MPTIPTQPPESFTAGETVKWTHTFSDFPASDSWTCAYKFDGPAQFSVSTTASGAAFAVSIAASTTDDYTPGDYTWVALASKAGETYVAASGSMRILRNPASGTVSAAYTAWQNALTAYQELAAGKVANGTINGKTFTAHSLTEMRRAVEQLKADYLREKRADDLAAGRGGSRVIKTIFTEPR